MFSFFPSFGFSGNDAYPGVTIVRFVSLPDSTAPSKSFDQYSKLKIRFITAQRDKLSSNEIQRRGRSSTALTDYVCSRLKLNRFSLNNRPIIQHAR